MKPATLNAPDELPDIELPAVSWDCACCGKLRVCPFALPYPRGPKVLDACRVCGDLFVDADDDRLAAIRTAIKNHLI